MRLLRHYIPRNDVLSHFLEKEWLFLKIWYPKFYKIII